MNATTVIEIRITLNGPLDEHEMQQLLLEKLPERLGRGVILTDARIVAGGVDEDGVPIK
jgi:hypothetical protein